MSEANDGEKFEFLAGLRADIVGYTDTDKESIIRIKQQIFSESIANCKTYHELINDVYFEERAGDDIIIIVPTNKIVKLIHFAEELTENLVNESQLKREQREEFIDDVKVRIGIYAGNGFIKKDTNNNKIISITGNVMIYLKRITDIGSAGHILLTEAAINTIFALTTQYKGNLYNAGKYPIKHYRYLDVWYYKNGNIGRSDPPPRKKLPLIKYLTKRNYPFAISLIALSTIGFSLGLATLLDNNDTTELNNLKTIIQDEIHYKYLKLIQDKNLIENILQQQIDKININQDQVVLSTTLTPQLKNELNSMLTAISEEGGVKYSWISKIKPELCTITLYKPYDRDFINTTDFREKPWCNDLNYYDAYLTKTYYASGPHDFVNTLVSEINIKLPDGKSKTIGYLGKALEWNDIIPPLLASSNKPRLILIDEEGYIAFDCTFWGCKDLDNYYNKAIVNQKPKIFNSSYIGGSFGFFSLEKVNMENKLGNNNNIFNNWTLYILSEKIYEIMDYLIFGSISVIFGLIIYYYLVPRYWLDGIIKDNK